MPERSLVHEPFEWIGRAESGVRIGAAFSLSEVGDAQRVLGG